MSSISPIDEVRDIISDNQTIVDFVSDIRKVSDTNGFLKEGVKLQGTGGLINKLDGNVDHVSRILFKYKDAQSEFKHNLADLKKMGKYLIDGDGNPNKMNVNFDYSLINSNIYTHYVVLENLSELCSLMNENFYQRLKTSTFKRTKIPSVQYPSTLSDLARKYLQDKSFETLEASIEDLRDKLSNVQREASSATKKTGNTGMIDKKKRVTTSIVSFRKEAPIIFDSIKKSFNSLFDNQEEIKKELSSIQIDENFHQVIEDFVHPLRIPQASLQFRKIQSDIDSMLLLKNDFQDGLIERDPEIRGMIGILLETKQVFDVDFSRDANVVTWYILLEKVIDYLCKFSKNTTIQDHYNNDNYSNAGIEFCSTLLCEIRKLQSTRSSANQLMSLCDKLITNSTLSEELDRLMIPKIDMDQLDDEIENEEKFSNVLISIDDQIENLKQADIGRVSGLLHSILKDHIEDCKTLEKRMSTKSMIRFKKTKQSEHSITKQTLETRRAIGLVRSKLVLESCENFFKAIRNIIYNMKNSSSLTKSQNNHTSLTIHSQTSFYMEPSEETGVWTESVEHWKEIGRILYYQCTYIHDNFQVDKQEDITPIKNMHTKFAKLKNIKEPWGFKEYFVKCSDLFEKVEQNIAMQYGEKITLFIEREMTYFIGMVVLVFSMLLCGFIMSSSVVETFLFTKEEEIPFAANLYKTTSEIASAVGHNNRYSCLSLNQTNQNCVIHLAKVVRFNWLEIVPLFASAFMIISATASLIVSLMFVSRCSKSVKKEGKIPIMKEKGGMVQFLMSITNPIHLRIVSVLVALSSFVGPLAYAIYLSFNPNLGTEKEDGLLRLPTLILCSGSLVAFLIMSISFSLAICVNKCKK